MYHYVQLNMLSNILQHELGMTVLDKKNSTHQVPVAVSGKWALPASPARKNLVLKTKGSIPEQPDTTQVLQVRQARSSKTNNFGSKLNTAMTKAWPFTCKCIALFFLERFDSFTLWSSAARMEQLCQFRPIWTAPRQHTVPQNPPSIPITHVQDFLASCQLRCVSLMLTNRTVPEHNEDPACSCGIAVQKTCKTCKTCKFRLCLGWSSTQVSCESAEDRNAGADGDGCSISNDWSRSTLSIAVSTGGRISAAAYSAVHQTGSTGSTSTTITYTGDRTDWCRYTTCK